MTTLSPHDQKTLELADAYALQFAMYGILTRDGYVLCTTDGGYRATLVAHLEQGRSDYKRELADEYRRGEGLVICMD